MGLGAKFVIDCDNKSVPKIQETTNAMKGLEGVVKGELATKLKMLFSVAAIEQAAQKTGEWAQKLDQTSKSMGITNTMLQSLQLLAAKANVPEEAVMSMYENIDKARKEALNGNAEYIASLNRLGVTMDDIRTLTKEEFLSKAVAGVQKIQAGAPNGDISKADNLNRLDIEKITGTPENFLNQIGQSLNGNTMLGEKKEEESTGQIIPEGTVNELSATWANLVVDLKQIGTDLKPAASLLLAIFDDIINALGGVITLFKGIFDFLKGILTGDMGVFKQGLQEFFGVALNFCFGVLKIFTSVFDLIAKGLAKVFGELLTGLSHLLPKWMGGDKIRKWSQDLMSDKNNPSMTEWVNKQAKISNDALGTGGKMARGGEGIANTAGLVLTGGESGIAKGAQYGLGRMAAVASKLGMENKAEYLLNKSFNLRNKAAGTEGLFGDKTISQRIAESVEKSQPMSIARKFGQIGVKAPTEEEIALMSKISARGAVLLGAAGNIVSSIKTGMKPGTPGSKIVPPIPNIGAFMGTGNSSSTTGLKIGGVFGSNYQSRMVLLNQKMVELLGQISSNTAVIKASTVIGGQTPPTGYGGGV
jgi:hypothetical protein